MSRAEKADSNRNLPPDQQNARNASVKTRRENLALGFDLGGTNLKTLLIGETGQVYHKSVKPSLWEQGIEVVLQSVTDAASLAKETASYLDMDIRGAGLGICGPFDYERGEMIESPLLPGLRNVPFAKLASDCIELPVLGENDANLAILGEWWKGVGRRDKVVAGLTLGTGIGGGLIVEGDIFRGGFGFAGEFGHISVANRPECPCGGIGCLGRVASCTGTLARYEELMEKGETAFSDFQSLYSAAQNGDKKASQAIAESVDHLSAVVLVLVNCLNPNVFVLTGGMTILGNILLDPISEFVKTRTFDRVARSTRIEIGSLEMYSGAFGAAYLVLKSHRPPERT